MKRPTDKKYDELSIVDGIDESAFFQLVHNGEIHDPHTGSGLCLEQS